jgi:DNA polymerase-3 subunit beta
MKITVNKSELSAALKLVGKTCSPAGNIPVLSNIRIIASVDFVNLGSTNLDQQTTTGIDADVDEDGEVLVPFRRFNSIIANLDGETVEIQSEGSETQISSGRFTASVQGVDIAEWPECANKDDSLEYRIDAVTLSRAITSSIGCASTDETRYILNGVLIKVTNGIASVVATDGRQLAVSSMDVDRWHDFGAVIPTLAADAITDICKGNETATVAISSEWLSVRTKTGEIWSKLIAGKFPEWRRVMPDESQMRTFPAPHKKLLGILRRVGLIADPRIGCVRLDGSADGIAVSSSNAGESAAEMLECDSPEFGVSVNHNFLAKMLATIDGESVNVKVGEDESPVLIESGRLKYIIMPMRK